MIGWVLRCRAKFVLGLPVLVVWFLCAFVASSQGATDNEGIAFFESHVRPILVESCSECHGAKKQESGLRVDTLAGLLKGGDRGPAVVPGDAGQSLLLTAVRHFDAAGRRAGGNGSCGAYTLG